MKKFALKAVSAAVFTSVATLPMTASATNGILAYGNGMIAHGMGGAGIANAAEAMSAVDNPALAAKVGASWGIGASAFNPNRSANVGMGDVDSDSDWFLIPHGAWLTEVGDNAVAGVTVSALGGMNTDYPPALFGTTVGIDLAGIIIAPTYAINTGSASFGGQLLLGYEALESTGPGAGGLPRDDDDSATGFGFKLGATFDVSDSTTVGLTYQSKIKMDEMDNHASFIFAQASEQDLSLPVIAGLGISSQVNDQWKVAADIMRVNWSDVAIYDELFGWEDQTVFKIGAEVGLANDLKVRFGFNHGDSPIPDTATGRNILAPAVTEDHYTVGFSKPMGAGTLSGYYARIPEAEQSQTGGPGGFPKIRMDQNAFGVAYHVEF